MRRRRAQKLDKPPFYSWPVTGGITFTFGGLKINKNAPVISTGRKPIEGLYCAGKMVGGRSRLDRRARDR